MDGVFIDEETGEDLIYPLDDYVIRRGSMESTINDAETGEPEVNLVNYSTVKSHIRKVPFQVHIYKECL